MDRDGFNFEPLTFPFSLSLSAATIVNGRQGSLMNRSVTLGVIVDHVLVEGDILSTTSMPTECEYAARAQKCHHRSPAHLPHWSRRCWDRR